jgi:hypothetical protein
LLERTAQKVSWQLIVWPLVTLLNEHSWRKENDVITAKKNVYVVVLGDKISDSSA